MQLPRHHGPLDNRSAISQTSLGKPHCGGELQQKELSDQANAFQWAGRSAKLRVKRGLRIILYNEQAVYQVTEGRAVLCT